MLSLIRILRQRSTRFRVIPPSKTGIQDRRIELLLAPTIIPTEPTVTIRHGLVTQKKNLKKKTNEDKYKIPFVQTTQSQQIKFAHVRKQKKKN